MRKFQVGDLVTVVENSVWYTHLNDGLRDTLIGRTGRVVKIDQLTFTKEDLEINYMKKLISGHRKNDWKEVADDWSETTYDCMVVFPWMPDRPICFAEAHLKEFEMPS